MKSLIFIDAVPADHRLLTETAMASKRSWGYSDEAMGTFAPELEITESYIAKNKVVKVFYEGKFIGFFGIKLARYKDAEIEHLWLIPSMLRQGCGRIIFQYLREYLKKQFYRKATLVADPNSKGFYMKMGGKVTGKHTSNIPGRMLDVFEFEF